MSERVSTPKVSSELARVEVVRACRRIAADALPAARALLTGVNLIPMTRDLLDEAGVAGSTSLRSLDAIHLASALSIREDLSAFVGYGVRLTSAAAEAGLLAVQPGA